MQYKVLQTTMDIIFSEFLLLYQISFLPQVQRSVMISNKQGIYKLSNELLKGPRLRILGNLEISRKSKKFILPMTTPRSKVPLFPQPTCLKCKHSPFPSPHAHNEKITGPIQCYYPIPPFPRPIKIFRYIQQSCC